MTHQDPLAHLQQALADLESRGLRRVAAIDNGGPEPSFCSNDYLGLAQRRVAGVAGSGASRLISGQRTAHHDLERALSRWLRTESALLFSSGYAANLGTLAALAAPGDLIVSDALNHASLIDGARLSRARTVVTPHNDLRAVRTVLRERTEARAWVVVESYFSMDADGPDLGGLREICDEARAALIVDEAHAVGVLGPGGRGRAAEASIAADVLVGTLGKAFGGQGAFVAGRTVLRDWLWNRARSFVFSTGLSPILAVAAREALTIVEGADVARQTLAARAARLREGLCALGVEVLGFGHIVPIVVGSPDRAVRLAAALRAEGIHVAPIRPPTVPEGTARLRLTVTAQHAEEDVDRLLGVFGRALSREGR